jgi:hypothetical protein
VNGIGGLGFTTYLTGLKAVHYQYVDMGIGSVRIYQGPWGSGVMIFASEVVDGCNDIQATVGLAPA